MKSGYWVAVFGLLAMQPALAETCQEKFVRLLQASQELSVPTKKVVVTEMKNGPTMTNENYWLAPDHTMTTMKEPPGPWMLIHGKTMYTSMDEGKTWSKLRMVDEAATQNHMDALAATVSNAVCGEAVLDGVTHDLVEADYTMGEGANLTNIHDKYWVSRDDEFIPKSETSMKMEANGFESFVTQTIEKAPDLVLPVPD